jgi:hypothetical protein
MEIPKAMHWLFCYQVVWGLVRSSPPWPSRFFLSDAIWPDVSPLSTQFFGRLSSAQILHDAIDNTGTKVTHFLGSPTRRIVSIR